MPISFYTADIKNTLLAKPSLREWLHFAVSQEGLKVGSISIIQCSNPYLLDLNIQYLQHDYFTDVITFPSQSSPAVSGEIYISVDQAKIQAKEHQHHIQKEMQLLVIHGVMHLCGYPDKTKAQAKIMRKKESNYMNLRPEKLLLVSRETYGK